MSIRVRIHNYNERSPSARRDGAEKAVEITSRLNDVSWSSALVSPYEQAQVNVSVRIDELSVLGIGTPRNEGQSPALHASGWLEILVSDVREFFGPIISVSTGLSVDQIGRRISKGVQLSAVSWLSLLAQPFKLSSDESLLTRNGIYGYEEWADIFEAVFSQGAALSVSEGFREAWLGIVQHSAPDGLNFSNIEVLSDSGYLQASGVQGRSLTRVEGKNISQAPVASSGSLWSILTSTFQPTPQLIELFPFWSQGSPYLMYRMKPPAPANSEYFRPLDRLPSDGEYLGITSEEAVTPQSIERVTSYQMSWSGARNNYIEVTSPYLGVSQLAGLNSQPIILASDIERYGLSSLEIPYPLLRDTQGSLRADLERLSAYAAALYAEDHAFARADLEVHFAPSIRVGEWAEWSGYDDDVSFLGYVSRITHRVHIDAETNRTVKKTSLQLERVSQGRRSSRKDAPVQGVVTIRLAGDS